MFSQSNNFRLSTSIKEESNKIKLIGVYLEGVFQECKDLN
jgi:hypothetical protein